MSARWYAALNIALSKSDVWREDSTGQDRETVKRGGDEKSKKREVVKRERQKKAEIELKTGNTEETRSGKVCLLLLQQL